MPVGGHLPRVRAQAKTDVWHTHLTILGDDRLGVGQRSSSPGDKTDATAFRTARLAAGWAHVICRRGVDSVKAAQV